VFYLKLQQASITALLQSGVGATLPPTRADGGAIPTLGNGVINNGA
jgi:hypothetical protein